MMKKMLVLALVLAVAGVANASYLLSYDDVTAPLTKGTAVSVSNDAGLVGGIACILGITDVKNPTVFSTLVTDNVTWRTVGAPISPDQFADIYTGSALQSNSTFSGKLKRFNAGAIGFTWGDATLTPAPAGFWVSMPFAGYYKTTSDKAEFKVDLVSDTGDAIAGLTPLYLTSVPEPMTMGLLALGALFLRKK